MHRVQDKVCIVTGGALGIGRACCERLADEGGRIALFDRLDAEGEALAAALRGRGVEARYWHVDVASEASVQAAVAAVAAHFGAIHVLVNNAGVAPAVRADLLETGEESLDRLLSVNLKGPFFLTQAVARWMTEQKHEAGYEGAIVFVTSVSAEAASTNRGEYCMSKAALSMAARLFAVRLGPAGIPVYEVRPGVIRTDMTAGVAEKYDRLIAEGAFPQGRWGEPEDVGRVVAALARGDAAYSTGAVIPVDGGFSVPRL